MAYTLGTTHTLTGSGSVGISTPVGLKVGLSSVPSSAGIQFGTPPELYGIGRISVGNADGYLARVPLHHQAGLLYPIAPDMTLLAYDVVAGVTLTVQELLPVVDIHLLQPWDRSPVQIAFGGSAGTAGPNAIATPVTYTVATGKIALISHAAVRTVRTTAAGGTGRANCRMTIGGLQFLNADLYSNGIGDQVADELAAPLYLPAGTVITVTHRDDTTGGIVIRAWMLYGLEFAV